MLIIRTLFFAENVGVTGLFWVCFGCVNDPWNLRDTVLKNLPVLTVCAWSSVHREMLFQKKMGCGQVTFCGHCSLETFLETSFLPRNKGKCGRRAETRASVGEG